MTIRARKGLICRADEIGDLFEAFSSVAQDTLSRISESR